MTAGLLVFAVATVGVALRDEIRRHDGEARSVSPLPTVVSIAASPTAAVGAPLPPVAPAPAPERTGAGIASRASAEPVGKPTRLIVYYFHTTTRCVSCYRIESLTQFSLDSDFGVELADGDIEWRPVNIDTPGNGHYAKDYGLFTKSVVLSAVREGREQKWRNLDRVWHLLDDPKGFREYIGEEVRTFRTAS